MDIKKSEHFIPISRIPILPSQDTISDAMDAMKERDTRLAVVADGTLKRPLWLDDISRYCSEKGPVTPWMVTLKKLMEEGSAAPEFDLAKGPGEIALLLEKERAVMVMEGGELVGVATMDNQALWPPAVSECVQGHLFFPPLPKKCPYDGTMIG